MQDSEAAEILKNVDLGGYSRSAGFLGHFFSRENICRPVAETATKLCIEGVGQELQNAFVLSSAHADFQAINEGRASKDDVQIIRRLVDHGVLSEVDFGAFGQDHASDRYQQAVKAARERFMMLALNQFGGSDVVDFFATKMLVFGVFGHCFLYLEKRALLLYPHEEGGFGIIATGAGADHRFGRDLMARIAATPPFESRESEALRRSH